MILPFDNTYNRTNADHYRTFTWDSFNSMEINRVRNYSDLRIKRISQRPSFIQKLVFYNLPELKSGLKLEYRIIK
jgi:hypothetical protein